MCRVKASRWRTLRGLWQGLEQPIPVVKWVIASRWAERSLACWPALLPIANRLCNETCFRVVMRQQFGLGLGGLWKLCFQHLGNALMVLLSSTL